MDLLTAPLFGTKHLIGLLFVVVLITVLFIIVKRKESNSKKVILIASIAFIILEIIKLTTMVINKGSFPMNQLPLHLCSLPLYVFPILYFTEEGSTVNKFVKPAAFATVLAAGIAALALPTNILGNNETWIPFDGNFYPLISFIYHGLMLFVPAYMLYSGYYVPKYSDIPKAMGTTACLMVLAMIANVIFDKDYMLLNTGKGSPLQFLLEHGQFVYTFTMIGLGLIVISTILGITVAVKDATKELKTKTIQ